MSDQAVRPRGGRANARAGGKSAEAFRTISEVSDELDVPQHVLRFWETKFSQVRPLKRGGGRRYYRPDDIELLRRIRDLLYRDGFTIKGVQKLLREGRSEAVAQVAAEPEVAKPAAADAAGRDGLDPQTRRELETLRAELAELRALLHAALKI